MLLGFPIRWILFLPLDKGSLWEGICWVRRLKQQPQPWDLEILISSPSERIPEWSLQLLTFLAAGNRVNLPWRLFNSCHSLTKNINPNGTEWKPTDGNSEWVLLTVTRVIGIALPFLKDCQWVAGAGRGEVGVWSGPISFISSALNASAHAITIRS